MMDGDDGHGSPPPPPSRPESLVTGRHGRLLVLTLGEPAVWTVRRSGARPTLALLSDETHDDARGGIRYTLRGPGLDLTGPDWRALLDALP